MDLLMIENGWRGTLGKHLQPVWLATLTGTNSGTLMSKALISQRARVEKGNYNTYICLFVLQKIIMSTVCILPLSLMWL